jgi:hypothetical protein
MSQTTFEVLLGMMVAEKVGSNAVLQVLLTSVADGLEECRNRLLLLLQKYHWQEGHR